MPDLATLALLPASFTLIQCPLLMTMSTDSAATESLRHDSAVKPALTPEEPLEAEEAPVSENGDTARVLKKSLGSIMRGKKVECLAPRAQKNTESGVSESNLLNPPVAGAERLGECLVCQKSVDPGQEVACLVRGCKGVYHSLCVRETCGIKDLKRFKCLQHKCFICEKRPLWRCVRCTMASHDKCAPWPDKVIHLDRPGQAICWRHTDDCESDNKNEQHEEATSNIQELFCNLPFLSADGEFNIDFILKDMMDNKVDPPPYVHIKRNIYLVKKKRDDFAGDIGCTNCFECGEGCLCRVQCISCSKACKCSGACTNRPFRKEKKTRIVKTEFCGWGVEAAEPISKGQFIIEYIGEVINDAECEKRLWDMKYRGEQNFYLCEIRKDFTIDATFKGNASRFLNHSCDPNCNLEKWQVDGETHVGVFAARAIEPGEPLTYDYRFVQFGPEVKCRCGATNCQGYLGIKKKTIELNPSECQWGLKRRRHLRQKKKKKPLM